jgi:wyosine [tRNA(Phe)-imidazoG37] synthetase (radical SAM superfamily)
MTSPDPSKYGFYGRLTADFPSQIVVDITEVCNLACIHCPHPVFKKSEYYTNAFLDPALNAKMVSEVSAHGKGRTLYIRYTGSGEPLTHPGSYDMIQDAVERSGTYVTITTNGTTLNEKRMRRLLKSGVHLIDISIDAVKPETYAKIRVNGDLEVTRANVLSLIRWVREENSPTKVITSFVEQAGNSDEAAEFERFWKEAGASYVVIRRQHSSAGAVVQIAGTMRERLGHTERRPCLYPWERITINPRGELAFCPQDWTHGSALASYRDTTILDLWSGPQMQALREAHLTNNFRDHGFCGQCPDWSVTSWPGEGRVYADMIQEFIAPAAA